MIDLLPGEHIIMVARKHWFIFFVETIGLVLAAIVPILFAPFAERTFTGVVAAVGPERFENLLVFVIIGWLILLTMIFFVVFTTYTLDLIVITNQRIIDMNQIALFARDVAAAPFEKLEDVKTETLGILATVFGFGNLYIQTAGEKREIMIRGVRNPERAKETIMQAYEQIRARHGGQA